MQSLWKTWRFLKKLKPLLPYIPEISLLAIYRKKKKKKKPLIQKIHDPSVHSSIIDFAKAWKQLQCL